MSIYTIDLDVALPEHAAEFDLTEVDAALPTGTRLVARPGGWSARFVLDATNALGACQAAIVRGTAVEQRLGLPEGRLSAARVHFGEAENALSIQVGDGAAAEPETADEATASPVPALAGAVEAARLLGVSRPKLTTLAQRGDFPEPAVTLAATPVWRVEDLMAWSAAQPVEVAPAPRRRASNGRATKN